MRRRSDSGYARDVAQERSESASSLDAPFPSRQGTTIGYRAFTAAAGSWFGAFGMQGVLFAWILVGELHADSEWVGTAQTATMLPNVFLLMIGGATADRFDPRRLLIGLHLIAMIPVLTLAYAAGQGALSIPLVVGFALAMGTLTAFANPARDALLSRVSGENMMGAVSGVTAVQFASQATGSLVAALARVIGSPTTLLVHACVLGCGAFFAKQIPRVAEDHSSSHDESHSNSRSPTSLRATVAGMREGLAIVARTPALRGSLLAVFSVGLFFIGPFSVVLPLMIRDVYGGGVAQLAIAMSLFPLGTISGSLVLRRLGLRRKGRSMLLALFSAAVLEAAIGIGLPFWAFALAAFGWGLAGAIFINASRTIFQEYAPAAYRGRVLAAYQLGFMSGGPIGAFASGFAIAAVGLGGAFHVAAFAMGLLVLGTSLFSRIPEIE
jgi:MFS family permease